MRCHSCDLTLTADNWLSDTCDTCLMDCGCLSCVELRNQLAEDRHADMAYRVARDAS